MSAGLDMEWFRGKLEARRAELQGLQAISEESRGTVALDQTSVGRLSRTGAIQGPGPYTHLQLPTHCPQYEPAAADTLTVDTSDD